MSAISQDGDLSADGLPREAEILAGVITILILICGVLGNLLTIVALLKTPKVRNVAAAFIISLCVADLIFCTVVLPFSTSRFLNGGWIHGDVMCRLVPFMRYGNVGVSLLSIAMITINRYVMIAHHHAYGRIYSPLNIGLMILFCWVFSYLMLTPTLIRIWGEFGYDEKLRSCTIMPLDGRSSKTALFIIAFLVPCIVIIVCYAIIFFVIHSSAVRMKQHKTAMAGPKIKEDRSTKKKRNEWRITQMVLAIFLSYVLCYLPITLTKVFDEKASHPGYHVLGELLLYFSSCVNPIIYVIMNKQYRKAYKNVFMWCTFGHGSLVPNASSADKSRDGQSRTMMSQVSFALSTLQAKDEERPYNITPDDNL